MKFKFGDKVRIKKGFFKGITGVVLDCKKCVSNNRKYWFDGQKLISTHQLERVETWIKEADLERI